MKKILLLVCVALFACSCANDEFVVNTNMCTGCGKCQKVCPNGVIAMDTIYERVEAWNDDSTHLDTSYVATHPKARIRPNRCVGCGKCQQACIKENGQENCAIYEK